jgi:hypothetical protein
VGLLEMEKTERSGTFGGKEREARDLSWICEDNRGKERGLS